MKNAVLYPRYSSTGQNEQSIDGQIRVCKEYAEKQGLNVIRIYDGDKAKSASKETEKRKDLHRMFTDAESGAFQYIIVYTMDRFARNRAESVLFKSQLAKLGVKVLSATEPISNDEGGELYEMFLEWNAEKYSQRLSKRVKDGLRTSIENGTYTGQRLILGYKLVATGKTGGKGNIHKVEIDEEQAEIIRYIFNEYANGTNKKVIADTLNEKGLRYRGKPFSHRTFEHWLNNDKYTGEFMFGDILCTNMFPQIIDKLLFEKVQERLKSNKILSGANSAIEPYLLTGKAFCGCCETPMIAGGGTSRNGKKHYYYACKKKTKRLCAKKLENKNNLEYKVTRNVIEFLSVKENVAIAAADTIRYYEQRTGDDGMKSIGARLQHAQKQVEDLTNSFIEAKNNLLRATIEKKMNDLEILLNDLYIQKSKLELERGLKITKEKILDFIANLIKGDPNDKAYQKQIIDNLVSQVFVYDDDNLVCYLTFEATKKEYISLNETNTAISSVCKSDKGVQSLSPLVPKVGLEPTRYCYQRILSPSRLPISPLRRVAL